jgi:hypothetical protein
VVLDPAHPAEVTPVPHPVSDDSLPAHWQTLVADRVPEVVDAWLQMAGEMARDAVAATKWDADLADLRELVRDALRAITTVRDDALG